MNERLKKLCPGTLVKLSRFNAINNTIYMVVSCKILCSFTNEVDADYVCVSNNGVETSEFKFSICDSDRCVASNYWIVDKII